MKKHVFFGALFLFLGVYLIIGAFSVVRQVARFRANANAELASILDEEPPLPNSSVRE